MFEALLELPVFISKVIFMVKIRHFSFFRVYFLHLSDFLMLLHSLGITKGETREV